MSVTNAVKTAIGLQILVFAAPLVSTLFQYKSAFPFPPMGDESQNSRFFAMLILGASALIPYFMPVKINRGLVVVLLIMMFIFSGLLYLSLGSRYVVALSDGATFVIRGTMRNPKLQEPYASMSDQDLIEHSGARDTDLQHAYVWESVARNRASVFRSYVFSLVVLQVFFGYAALTEKASTSIRKSIRTKAK